MGAVHIRTPKNFVLEERLERFADGWETHPQHLRGRWAEACAPCGAVPFARVHLDLGCGKGTYICERAQRETDTLFIGLDQEPLCIAYTAQKVVEASVRNALAVSRGADALAQIFAPGEVGSMTLNFPTPCPKARHATQRLVHVDRLMTYRAVLAPDATLTLRTDSKPLRDYAISQFEAAGYRTLWTSDDVRTEHPEHPETEYERRTRAKGAVVYGICGEPDAEPTDEQLQRGRDAERSLAAYLPDDLDSLDYVPLGMEEAVENFRNRRAKGKVGWPQNR